MTGKLSSIDSVNLAELKGSVCTSHSPGVHHASHRSEVLAHCLGASDVLMDITFLTPFLKEIMTEHSDHKVRRDEPAVLIHEHNTVSVTVKDHSDVRPGLRNEFLKIHDILEIQRVRLVIRETSVEFFIYI